MIELEFLTALQQMEKTNPYFKQSKISQKKQKKENKRKTVTKSRTKWKTDPHEISTLEFSLE